MKENLYKTARISKSFPTSFYHDQYVSLKKYDSLNDSYTIETIHQEILIVEKQHLYNFVL